jgi:hypothetical protein
MKTRLGWALFFVLFTSGQVAAVQVGKHFADQHSFDKGMCKINGLWNTAKMCRERHVVGEVWGNYR